MKSKKGEKSKDNLNDGMPFLVKGNLIAEVQDLDKDQSRTVLDFDAIETN